MNETLKLCTKALLNGNKLMFCGNGGSAELSNHLVTEFVCKMSYERKALNALSLCSNTALLTAIANDFGFERVFSRQLEAHAREGDVLFCISTSGKSKNVLEASKTAKSLKVKTIALTQKNSELQEVADHAVLFEGSTATVQEQQLVFGHKLVEETEKALGLL